jgi:hypothetical protein
MIQKIIITTDGIYFKKIKYENVKLSEVFITRDMAVDWIEKTKNNIIQICAEGETVTLTPDEYLECCFVNNEDEQIDLINYTLKRMQNEQKR